VYKLLFEYEVSNLENGQLAKWANTTKVGILCQQPRNQKEKEHASMVLEWIRRKDPKFSSELKDYLFTKKNRLRRQEVFSMGHQFFFLGRIIDETIC